MEKLYLGIKGHIVCLNQETGDKLWDTKIKNSSITNVYFENGFVFAYSGGRLYCLQSIDGKVKWENKLKGLGYGTCIIAGNHQNATVIASQNAAQQEPAMAGTSAAGSSGSGK